MANVLQGAARAARLRLRPLRQLFRLAGVRPPLCERRRRPAAALPAARASSRPCARAPAISRSCTPRSPSISPPARGLARRLRAARRAGLDDGRAAHRAMDRDRAHRAPRRARHLPHGGRGDDPAGPRPGRDPRALQLRPRRLPRAGPPRTAPRSTAASISTCCRPEGSASWHIRAPRPRPTWTRSTATSGTSTMPRASTTSSAATGCSTGSSRRPGGSVLEVGCGTGRNLDHARRGAIPTRASTASTFRPRCSRRRRARSRARGLDDRITLAHGDATRLLRRARCSACAAFDRVFISYALSMIPPWRAALRAGAGRGGAGRLAAYRRLRRASELPGWFRSGLRRGSRSSRSSRAAISQAELDALAELPGYESAASSSIATTRCMRS